MIRTVLNILPIVLIGCTPMYAGKPTEAKNSIIFHKSGMGDIGMSANVGADTEAHVQGLEYKTSGGSEAKVDDIAFKAMPSATIGSWAEPMRIYDAQLRSYYEGLANVATANWAGFTSAITAVAPIAGPYLSALGQAKLAQAQQPALVSQLADLTLAGKLNSASLQSLGADPLIIAQVDRLVEERIKRLLAPTTQPAALAAEKEAAAPPADAGGG